MGRGKKISAVEALRKIQMLKHKYIGGRDGIYIEIDKIIARTK